MTTHLTDSTTDTITHDLDEAAIEAFAEKVFGDLAGAHAVFMAALGDRLGLFTDLADRGPAGSSDLAQRTGLAERYVREWALGMAAAGYLDRDAHGTFSLPGQHVPVLADEGGPLFLGGMIDDYSATFGDGYRQLLDSFGTGEGIAQEDFPDAQRTIERLTAPWHGHALVQEWLPLAPDVELLLSAGGTLCDVGCGHGQAVIALARAFPQARFVGVDVYEPAVAEARRRAEAAGVADRVTFQRADASTDLPGTFDVVTVFDVLHDARDPEGILRTARAALRAGGRFLAVDIDAADDPAENTGPLGTMIYGLSLEYCLPVSMHDGGTGLGTAGLSPQVLTRMASAAGFADVRKVEITDPLSALYVLTPAE
ncbi:class I SAM-dependent methyltransferase [Isoptericola rhizosphaerae]|uniref:class I SAM-dependent methyltransferase n=1 Tax=Isoptericola rhizosphaerae TaxID=3377837 RepID=UPI00383A29BE